MNATTALLSMLLQASASQNPPVLQPNGKWTVAYEESMCLVSRKYGPNGDVTLLLRPSPLGDSVEITFIRAGPSKGTTTLDAPGKLTIVPAGKTIDVSYKSWFSRSANGRAVIAVTEENILNDLSDASVLTLSTKHHGAYSVAITDITKLKPVVEDCKRTVAKHWGVDPAELTDLGTRATSEDPARFISYTDYPDEAVRKGQTGVTTILWTVGLDGRASDCRVIVSSGVPALDRAACNAVVKRARYASPALDKAGKPMLSHNMRRVMWLIPG